MIPRLPYKTQLKPDKVFIDSYGKPVWVFIIKNRWHFVIFVYCVMDGYELKIASLEKAEKKNILDYPNGNIEKDFGVVFRPFVKLLKYKMNVELLIKALIDPQNEGYVIITFKNYSEFTII